MSLREHYTSYKNSLHWVYLTVSTFKNWPYIYWLRLTKKHPALLRLTLRAGVIFEVRDKNSTLPIITEIWHDKVYGDLAELQGENDPVIIDIGGNIGVFSLFALSKIPNSRVYAFEPEPQNFACLQKNLLLNKMEGRSTAINKAVCGTKGQRLLFLTGQNSGTNSMFNQSPTSSKIEVSCTTLEDIFSEFNLSVCHLLKIDCEGAEYEILMQTSPHIFQKIERIILEWHDVPGQSGTALAAFLETVGYRVTLDYPVGNVMTAVQAR